MAEFLTSPTSLAVGENKANYIDSADAVAADDHKDREVIEVQIKLTESKINELLARSRSDLTEVKMKIAATETIIEELLARSRSLKVMAESLISPTSLAIRENKDNDKEYADAVAGGDQKEFPDGDTVLIASKILPAYRGREKFLKLMDDLEIRLDVAEKNTKELSKSTKEISQIVKEQSNRLKYRADLSNASFTRSQTLGRVRRLCTAFGSAGLVAGILVGLLAGHRR